MCGVLNFSKEDKPIGPAALHPKDRQSLVIQFMDRQTVNAYYRSFASKFVRTQSRRINTYRSARKSDLMDTSNPPQAVGSSTLLHS